VEARVHRQSNNHRISQHFSLPRSVSVARAICPPLAGKPWNGILLATLHGIEDAQDVRALLEAWQPLIAIIALPSTSSRSDRNQWLKTVFPFEVHPGLNQQPYHRKDVTCRHTELGGVTTSLWHFVHISRLGQVPPNKQAIMMAPEFSRALQTALQDTLGAPYKGKRPVFEPTHTVRPLKGVNTAVLGVTIEQQSLMPQVSLQILGNCPEN
jgi:hypothetical protein